MPSYLAPGVYIETLVVDPSETLVDDPSPALPQPAASGPGPTATRSRWHAEKGLAAFVGALPGRGAAEVTLVRGWREFLELFSPAPSGREDYLTEAVRGFFANGGAACYVAGVGSPDGQVGAGEIGGDHAARTGLAGLEHVPDVSMVCLPALGPSLSRPDIDLDVVLVAYHQLAGHCEMMGDRVALVDLPRDMSAERLLDLRARLPESAHAAVFHPWLRPVGAVAAVPPSGYVAGLFAGADRTQGPHAVPVGVPVLGVAATTGSVSRQELDILAPRGINVLAAVGSDVVLRSARTLDVYRGWRTVRVTRTMAFLSRNIRQGTAWAVGHRPDDPHLWAQLRHEIDDLLGLAWRSGMLAGRTAAEAYQVRCDDRTNPAEEVASGVVRLVGTVRLDAGTAVHVAVVWNSAY